MIRKSKKAVYLTIVGFLTCTAASAAYWQSSRYLQSKARWSVIAKQLSKKDPDFLSSLSESQRYPLKYVQVEGSMDDQVMLISRARDGRMGHIIVRAIEYIKEDGKKQTILAVEGWIPEEFTFTPTAVTKKFRGILRQKEKVDYLHKKIKAEDLEKFNINTYIDVEKAQKTLNLEGKVVITDYFLEILKDLEQSEANHYPYQYRVDNFQLPYLTPDKHRAYATFWSLTTMVGLGAILKVLKMK